MAQPGHVEHARTPHGFRPGELRGPVYWGTPHSTPQFWVNRFLLCYARVHSRPMRDLGQIAQSDHCGPTRHVQRPRDGLALAPSVSTMPNPVATNALGMCNGPVMAWCWHHLYRPAQVPSCACSVARFGLDACRSFHSRPVRGPL